MQTASSARHLSSVLVSEAKKLSFSAQKPQGFDGTCKDPPDFLEEKDQRTRKSARAAKIGRGGGRHRESQIVNVPFSSPFLSSLVSMDGWMLQP